MRGEKLHEFDIALCEYALYNIRQYLGERSFLTTAEEMMDPAVLAHTRALAHAPETEPLLLNDEEFQALAIAVQSWMLNRNWSDDECLHRRSIECFAEIRAELAGAYAEEWANASARFGKALCAADVDLPDGIEIVYDWCREVRRLLRALRATAFLPHPEGLFPTPTCPKPPPLAPATPVWQQAAAPSEHTLLEAITETQALQREVRDLLLKQRTIKDFYTTAELATLLGKAEFTVREWCRNGRVHGQKQGSGRGKHQAWVISHVELQRLQREGLLPVVEPR